MPTPWAAYRTLQPEPFRVTLSDTLTVTAGVGPDRCVSCQLYTDGQIEVLVPGARRPEVVGSYELQLNRQVQGQTVPLVQLHPFAFLHLFATEQMDRVELMEIVLLAGQGVKLVQNRVVAHCPLRAMLGGNFVLGLATHYDLSVT